MNREILFRGKLLNGQDWETGFPMLEYFSDGSIKNAYILKSGYDSVNGYFVQERYPVISETVGQFTGVTDKNGNKIFEGDILYDGVQKYEVRYSKTACAFDAFGKRRDGIWSLYHLAHEGNMHRKIEVIGNIYDSSKLINRNEQTH